MIFTISCAGSGGPNKKKSPRSSNKKDKKTHGAEMIIRESNALINDSRDIIKALSSDFDKLENRRIENENMIISEQENNWLSLLSLESKDWHFFDNLYDTKLAQDSELDQVIIERSSQYDLYSDLMINLEQKKILLSQIKNNKLAANAEKSLSSLLLALNLNLKRYLARQEGLRKSKEDREKKRHETLDLTSENIPFSVSKNQEQLDREALRIEKFSDEILAIAKKVEDPIAMSPKGYALLKQRIQLLNRIITLESICDYVAYGHYLDDSCFELRSLQEYAKHDLDYMKDYGASYHVYDVDAAFNYKEEYIDKLFSDRDNFDKDLETYSKLVERLEQQE